MNIDENRGRQMRQLSSGSEWVSFYTDELSQVMVERAREQPSVQTAGRTWKPVSENEPLNDKQFLQHALFDLSTGASGPLIMESHPQDSTEKPEDIEQFKCSLAETHVSLYEVIECRRGRGLALKDRLTDTESFVNDAALADTLEPMEVILGRLVNWNEEAVLLPGWEKVWFRGRKAAIRDLDAAMNALDLGLDDPDSRTVWLRREAPKVVQRAREARPD